MILRAVLFFSSCRISTKKGHFTERHAAGCIWQMLLAIRRLIFFFCDFLWTSWYAGMASFERLSLGVVFLGECFTVIL